MSDSANQTGPSDQPHPWVLRAHRDNPPCPRCGGRHGSTRIEELARVESYALAVQAMDAKLAETIAAGHEVTLDVRRPWCEGPAVWAMGTVERMKDGTLVHSRTVRMTEGVR